MKKFLMLMSLFVSMASIAEEIDLRQLDEMLEKQSYAYENVKEGMVVEYLESDVALLSSIGRDECLWHVVEQVIKVEKERYLVSRVKRTLTDCENESELQLVEWREILKSKDLSSKLNETHEIKELNLEGFILTIIGNDYFQMMDLSQSQFSSSIFLNDGYHRRNFLRRRFDKIHIDFNPSLKNKI